MRQINYKKKIRELIEQLHKQYPTYDTGRHISTAFADYGDIWGLTEKEFCFALEKYIAEMELDHAGIAPDDYVKKVIADTELLFGDTISDYEEEEEED